MRVAVSMRATKQCRGLATDVPGREQHNLGRVLLGALDVLDRQGCVRQPVTPVCLFLEAPV